MTQPTPIDSLLADLRSPLDAYPQELVNELLARRDEAVPELLALFDDQQRIIEDVVDCGEFLPFFALYMLAYVQEKRFYPVLLNVLRWKFTDADEFDAFWGDILFEDVPSILFSVYDGNSSPLLELVLTTKYPLTIRNTALSVLGMLYAHDQLARDELLDVIRKSIELERNSPEEYNLVISECCALILDLQLEELKDEAARLIQKQLHNFSRIEDLILAFSVDPREAHEAYLESAHNQGIHDIEKSVDWWFTQAIAPDEDEFEPNEDDEEMIVNIPVVRVGSKTGRNDLCPCGSGKKYKKCCGE